MTSNRPSVGETVDRRTVKSATKLLFGTLTLLGLLALATMIPVVDTLFPGTDIAFIELATAVVSMAVVAVLFALASRLATLTRKVLSGPRILKEYSAGTVYWLVVLVAVLVAHWGLSPVAASLLGEAIELYDLAFMLAALVALIAVAVRVVRLINPAADLVADALTDSGT